jgi:hypothetical protein
VIDLRLTYVTDAHGFTITNRYRCVDFFERPSICYGRAMPKLVIALLPLLACLPLAAQDAGAQKNFAGTWEAKFKDQVICTIRVRAGEPVSGETADCSINVDENGDLKEPDSSDQPDQPSPMLNPKLQGDTLTFEVKEGDDVIKFEMKVVGDRQAELKILDAPIPVKPIHFARK